MFGLTPRLWLFRSLLPVLGDTLILCGALAASFAFRQPSLLRADVLVSFGPLFGLWGGAFYAMGLYEMRQIRDFVLLVRGLLASGLLCWALGTSYFYLLSPYLDLTPKTHLALVVTLSHVAMLTWRRAILALTDFSLLKMRLVVLADGAHLSHLRQSLTNRFESGMDLAESLEAGADLVVADGSWVEENWDEARRVFSAAVARRVPIVSLDSFYESLFGKVSPLYAAEPDWALEHILPRAGSLYFRSKRLFDVAAAAAGLLILAPFFALLAAAVRLVDGLPPLYGQRRVGYLGHEFTLWKFRTMRPNSDVEAFLPVAGDRDARVTRLGAFLRRYRLDELPQLWNVLAGEMSLVGPRPEWVKEVVILEKTVPNYHLRHLVPPGITGWAQVYYRATNDPKESLEKHHYDLYYLKHFSLALDLTILLKTLKRVFVRDSRVATVYTPFTRTSRARALSLDIASIISRT